MIDGPAMAARAKRGTRTQFVAQRLAPWCTNRLTASIRWFSAATCNEVNPCAHTGCVRGNCAWALG